MKTQQTASEAAQAFEDALAAEDAAFHVYSDAYLAAGKKFTVDVRALHDRFVAARDAASNLYNIRAA